MTEDGQVPARRAFAAWAARHTGAPRDADRLVEDVVVEHEHAGILNTDILGRRLVWKSVPAAAWARVTAPAIAPGSVDLWAAEPASLRAGTDHVTICETCRGTKKSPCAACGGHGTRVCTACGEQRKAYGYAANGSRRLLNCTSCRGKGALDCADCRRGIASCATCGGEGRLQHWVEIEWWRRSVTNVHPASVARQFGWSDAVADEEIARDAEVVLDVARPQRLTPADLGGAPAQWLSVLQPPLHAGERVSRQRLRIARAPVHQVRYRLGRADDRVAFAGRRFLPPPPDAQTAFARRASHLRSLAILLVCIGITAAVLSLGRGPFYASTATMCSLAALAAMLLSIHCAAAEWTGGQRRTGPWILTATVCLLLAIACGFLARPRLDHAASVLAAGDLDAAGRELEALGGDAPAGMWADLWLARIRRAGTPAAARELLAKIPRELPQHRSAAPLVYVPLAQDAVRRADWSTAAAAILEARSAGVDHAALGPLLLAMHEAANDAIAAAARESDAATRLRMRAAAEATLVAWERAADQWGTPPLIALRVAMARDVAMIEKSRRRTRR